MLTRKDFAVIAHRLGKEGADKETIESAVVICEQSNPRFDYERFIKAVKEARS